MPSDPDEKKAEKDAEKKEFGRYLKGLREAADLTQSQLADAMSVSAHQEIVRWEKGDATPSGDTVIKWFKACDVTVSTPLPQVFRSNREILESIEANILELAKRGVQPAQPSDAQSENGAAAGWAAGREAGFEAGFGKGWEAARQTSGAS